MERNPVVRQASSVREHLRRLLTADPGRFAGGSAVSDPLGLLAVGRERLASLRSPRRDGSAQAAAAENQGARPGGVNRKIGGSPIPLSDGERERGACACALEPTRRT
jgi:hypothetical protein